MGLLQFQLREFDVEEGRFTGHVATFSNSLVFVSPAIGLLKFNSAPGKGYQDCGEQQRNTAGCGGALDRCRRPEVSTNCQRRTSGLPGVVRHSVDFGLSVIAIARASAVVFVETPCWPFQC